MTNLYRKKPVVIEAVQFNGVRADDLEGSVAFDDWIATNQGSRKCRYVGDTFQIPTLEGVMTAIPGDWIIKGVSGELYPVKPEIFQATYEPVE